MRNNFPISINDYIPCVKFKYNSINYNMLLWLKVIKVYKIRSDKYKILVSCNKFKTNLTFNKGIGELWILMEYYINFYNYGDYIANPSNKNREQKLICFSKEVLFSVLAHKNIIFNKKMLFNFINTANQLKNNNIEFFNDKYRNIIGNTY